MNNFTIKNSGTLRFWGDWFGRPMDNLHILTDSVFSDENDTLTLYFGSGEICTIYCPVGIVLNETEYYVSDASKVVWQYYPASGNHNPGNQITIEYEKTDNARVVKKTKHGVEEIKFKGFCAFELC